MGKKDPRVDAYVRKSPEFARPMLEHLRAAVHAACPEVEETLKWGAPAFMHHGILCMMAAFKQHVMFHYWRSAQLKDPSGRRPDADLGRVRSLKELPSRAALVRQIRRAAALNASGEKPVRTPRTARRPLPVPADLKAALARSRRAQAAFEKFPPSHRREYVEWITGAKRAETRARRIAQAVEWIAEGKSRNWRYERC